MAHLNLQSRRCKVFSIKLQNCNLNLKKKGLNLKLLLLLLLIGAEDVVVVVVKAHDLTIKKGNNLPYNDLL